MVCVKCGREIPEKAAFCPHCGEKAAQDGLGPEIPLYQADVKTLLKSGRLVVYQDRTEFVTSSVQKSIFHYTGLVSVKKNLANGIDFITEDGRTETCPADKNASMRHWSILSRRPDAISPSEKSVCCLRVSAIPSPAVRGS